MTNSSRSTSSASVIREVWMLKMRRLVFTSGRGNSIFRSIRPIKIPLDNYFLPAIVFIAVNVTWTDQCRIQTVDLVCCHDDFDVSSRIETVKLVQKFQHGTLDFSFTAGRGIVTLGTDSIDFVDKNNGRCVFFRNTEKFSYKFGTVTEILLNQLWTDNTQEGCTSLVGDSLCQQSLSGSRYTV